MLFSFVSCAPANLAPSVPQVSISSSGRVMKVSADSVDPEGDHIILEWEIEKNGVWSSIELVEGRFRFEEDGVKKLRVRAVDSNGNASDYRNFTYDSTNHAPQKPEPTSRYTPMKGYYKAECKDSDGDAVTLEWQYKQEDGIHEVEWQEMLLDVDGVFEFTKVGPVLVRVRGIDAFGLYGPWSDEIQGSAFVETSLNIVYPELGRYLPDGKAQVYIRLGASGGSDVHDNTYYWRIIGESGNGEVFIPGESIDFHIGPDGQPVIDEVFEERGIFLDPGDYWIEIRAHNETGGFSNWSPVHIDVKPGMQYGYIRPVPFAFERPLFKQAEEVRFEHNLTKANLVAIREKYGNTEGTPKEELNLLENLGMSRRGDGKPVWAYMDDEKILHVVTTGNGIISVSICRGLVDNGNRDSYPDDWPDQIEYMFCGMENLKTADLSGLDLSNVSSLKYLFTDCKKLTKVIWPDMTDNNIRYISYTFAGCESLTEEPMDFDFVNLRSVNGLYKNCFGLTSVDLSNIDMHAVKDASHLFEGCKNLSCFKLPSDLGSLRDFGYMFAFCESLVEPDFSSIHVGKDFLSAIFMFYGCKNLKKINCDVNMEAIAGNGVFRGCSSLESLDLSHADIQDENSPGNPKDNCWFLVHMFEGCSSLADYDEATGKGLHLHDSFKIESPYKNDMFKDCPAVESKEQYDKGQVYGRHLFTPEIEQYCSDYVEHLTYIGYDPSIWRGNAVVME